MKYCLDTNVLFTFQQGIELGGNPKEVLENLTKAASKGVASFVIPQKIVEEIQDMLGGAHKEELSKFLSIATVKTPNIYTHSMSSSIMYEFVNDYRKRAYDGLKIAEDIVIQVAKNPNTSTNRVEFEKSLQPIKESLRGRYRNATRTGTLDSVADLDLILLSLEEDATLLSADEGVVLWGRKFGVKEMALPVFGKSIRDSLS